VATDVEEGAAVTEAILEAVEVVADAVEGAESPDKAKATFLPRVDGDPGRNFTSIAAACCPMVGANCRGILMTVAIWMAYWRGSSENSDGSGSRLRK
jgi:hypothetical protein